MRRLTFLSMLLLLTLLGVACSRTPREQALLNRLKEGAPQKEAFNVSFLFSEEGRLQAELTAPHAIEQRNGEEDLRIFDRGIRIQFYTPEGEAKSDLKAVHAIFKKQFNYAEMWEDVVVINNKSDTLETDTLFWNKEANVMHTRGQVIIRTPNERIYGDSLVGTTDFSEYKIFKIRGIVKVNQEGI
jgi:LPS export ABC transporter protein LptC